jgi:hypothetical protein
MPTAIQPPGRERPLTEQDVRVLGLAPEYAGGTLVLPLCPRCGAVIEGYDMDRPMIVVRNELVPAWEGGPLVSVPLSIPKSKPGRWRCVAHPCEHAVEVTDLRFEAHPPKQGEAGRRMA